MTPGRPAVWLPQRIPADLLTRLSKFRRDHPGLPVERPDETDGAWRTVIPRPGGGEHVITGRDLAVFLHDVETALAGSP